MRADVPLLGAHVLRRAQQQAHLRDRRHGVLHARARSFCQSQIRQQHAAIFGDENIFRLDVAVHDAAFVSGLHALRRVVNDLQHLRHGDQALAVEHLPRGLALDVVHDEIDQPALFADIASADDVGVIDLRGDARFHTEAVGVAHFHAARRNGENLDGHVERQRIVEAAIHRAHAALSEFFD